MDEALAKRLVDGYFERIRGYVRMRVPEKDGEDIVAEVFLRALARGEQMRGDDPGAWLFAIARSRVAQFYRSRRLREREGAIPHGRASQRTPRTPLEELEAAEFRELLLRKMSVLSELERELVALKFTDGLTNVQIARILSVAPNSLGVMLHRALKKLRRAMREEA